MNSETLLILDCGSKFTQLLAAFARNLNIYSIVRRYDIPINEIMSTDYFAVIVAGADSDKPAAKAAIECLTRLNRDKKVMLIGDYSIPIYENIEIVDNFLLENIAAKNSDILIKNLLFKDCGFSGNFSIKSFALHSIENIKKQIGDKKVICALSGGVDSSVAAALVSRAVGSQLTCIFVDHGMLRKDEGDKVALDIAAHFEMNFIQVNAQERFISKLSGVCDPEEKRKIIGKEFISVFEEEAKKLGQIDFLVQGTIYPDIIESGNDGETAIKKPP